MKNRALPLLSGLSGLVLLRNMGLEDLDDKFAMNRHLDRSGEIFFERSFGVMLARFNNTQVLPKGAVNPKSQRNQNDRCISGKLALTNLKRSGFVFIRNDSKL